MQPPLLSGHFSLAQRFHCTHKDAGTTLPRYSDTGLLMVVLVLLWVLLILVLVSCMMYSYKYISLA